MPESQSDHDIRDLLVRATVPDLGYDLDETLRTGHRVQRRRRLAALGGAVAAASAVAIAYGTLGGLSGRDAVPAGQQQAQKSKEAIAEILDYRYGVGVKPAAKGTGVTITTYTVTAGKRTPIESWNSDGKSISIAPTGADDGPLLGVAPAGATSFHPVGDEGPLLFDTAGHAPIGDTGLQAIGFRFTPQSDGTKVTDVIWTDETGAHNGAGEDLPSVQVTGSAWLVLDPIHRTLSNHGLTQAGNAKGAGGTYPEGSVPWRLEKLANPGVTETKIQGLSAMFVLPTQERTAKTITVRWSNGATTSATAIDEPSQGWTFAVTERTQGKNDGTGEILPTSVEWTDETGTVHKEPVKLR